MTTAKIFEIALTGALSAVVSGSAGWAAGGLTLRTEVQGIQASVTRIETRLDNLVLEKRHEQKTTPPAP